ncbi:hypothetical protein AQJ84_04540 [Streptomyces resistomycificus]|nr:hypothetical protein AQJ84_04540 [Streptomyces resistomycificus]
MFAVASMFGFEAMAIYGEEAREPYKTVPRATYLAVILITSFFAFTTWMLISAHGPSASAAHAGAALEAGDGAAFVAGPVADELGAWAGDALPILLATSLFASSPVPRLAVVAASGHLLPRQRTQRVDAARAVRSVMA